MNLSILILLILFANVLISFSISFFSLKPIFEGWLSMEISKLEIEIEKRRLFLILTINTIVISFNLHTLSDFSWLLFILVCVLSIIVFYITSKISYQEFHNMFQKSTTKNNKGLVISKEKISDTDIISNFSKKEDIEKGIEERAKNIEVVFTKQIYNLLRKYDLIHLSDNYNYKKTKDSMINSEEKIFRFKKYYEAKEFYNRVFDHSESEIKFYNKILGFSRRSLNEAPKKHKFSEEFKSFLKELEEIRKEK